MGRTTTHSLFVPAFNSKRDSDFYMSRYYLWASADQNYLRMAMPGAMEGVFMILLSSVGLIMVGFIGTAAIAAVSIKSIHFSRDIFCEY